jgi:hypothetical protein
MILVTSKLVFVVTWTLYVLSGMQARNPIGLLFATSLRLRMAFLGFQS